MIPPYRDDDLDAPERSLEALLATKIERICFLSLRVTIPGMVVTCGIFFLYTFVGMLVTLTGIWMPSYPLLSFSSNVYLAVLGLLAGLTVCLETSSIIILYMMRGIKTTRGQISTIISCIGFGASVVRVASPTVLNAIT